MPPLLQVQRSLSAPVVSKMACKAETRQTAPGLSRVLARVLGATECKENEADTKYGNPGPGDCVEDKNPAGETTQRGKYGRTSPKNMSPV